MFPTATSLRLIVARFQQLPLQSWSHLTHLILDWQPQIGDVAPVCPLAMCESLSGMHALRKLTIECPSVSLSGSRSSAGADPFEVLANKHNDMLRVLPGIDVNLFQQGVDIWIQAS